MFKLFFMLNDGRIEAHSLISVPRLSRREKKRLKPDWNYKDMNKRSNHCYLMIRRIFKTKRVEKNLISLLNDLKRGNSRCFKLSFEYKNLLFFILHNAVVEIKCK